MNHDDEQFGDDDRPFAPVRLWYSAHAESRWEAWVAEHGDGTFTAWACQAGSNAVALYVEDSFEHACAAAMFDLRRLARHGTCSAACQGWSERALPQ